MPTLLESLADYKQTYADVQRQTAERQKVMESPEYLDLKAKLDALTAHIPDSSEELALDREALIRAMNVENVLELEGCEVNTRKQREVDVRAVLEHLSGDLDALLTVATIKQKDLDEFCKANTAYRSMYKHCVIEKGVSVIDVLPIQL